MTTTLAKLTIRERTKFIDQRGREWETFAKDFGDVWFCRTTDLRLQGYWRVADIKARIANPEITHALEHGA